MTIMRCETCDSARMSPLSSMLGAALGLCTTVSTCMRGSSQRARSASCHMTGVRPNSCNRVHTLHACSGLHEYSPYTSYTLQYPLMQNSSMLGAQRRKASLLLQADNRYGLRNGVGASWLQAYASDKL